MTKKGEAMPHSTPSLTHPPVGTFVDGGCLELVEVLGVGGYGVVYRAVDRFTVCPRSYAVKCLISSAGQSARRQLHIREVTLHQIASAHPGVVTLHRIVEEAGYTFIVMDYASDHDLFTQILAKCRYLGNDALIKHVFLQILDAVEYCHAFGIYHRDLKPENILCFERGYRVAITDFGLATTEKMSEEYRTGSIYHMSPECQAADAKKTVPYSPLHNDIWSLGIILLNLATGRNPWKSATPDDATYQAYKQNPRHFLPSVLPISQELNKVLIQTLDVDWKSRMSISEMRAAVGRIKTFYSSNVVFEGSLARCPWESGLDLGNGVHTDAGKPQVRKRPVPKVPSTVEPYCVVSMSPPRSVDPRGTDKWHQSTPSYDIEVEEIDIDDDAVAYDPSATSDYSSDPSLPATPSSFGSQAFGVHLRDVDVFAADPYPEDGLSFPYTPLAGEGEDCYASSVFLATPICEQKRPEFAKNNSPYRHHRETGRNSPSTNSPYARKEHPKFRGSYRQESPSFQSHPVVVDHVIPVSPMVENFEKPTSGSRPIDIRRQEQQDRSHAGLLNSILFFPRSSAQSWLKTSSIRHQPTPPKSQTRQQHPADAFEHPYPDMGTRGRTLVDNQGRATVGGGSEGRVGGSTTQSRTRRDWFSGKFFRN